MATKKKPFDVQKVKPRELLAGESRRVKGIASDIDAVKIAGAKFRGNVSGAISEAYLERTIEGASAVSITCHDHDGELRRSKLFQTRAEIELDELWFRFVAMRINDDQTTVVFEDKEVARMRQVLGPAKALRDKFTRAEFIVSRVREIRRPVIPIWVPELHTVQPIKNERQGRQAKRDVELERGKGLDTGAKLTVKGEPAQPDQLRNGDRVLRVGASLNAPRAALIAVIATGIAENLMRNSAGGLGTSDGYFQILDSTAANLGISKADLEECALTYFTKGFTDGTGAVALAKQGLGPAAISARVQGNAAGEASYSPHVAEAEEWVDAFAGGGISGTVTTTTEVPYAFEQKPSEDIWTCAGRLMEEVNWRRFVANGVLYLIAEPDLLASRVSMRADRKVPGIDSISGEYDMGKKVDEVTVVGRARAWAAPPGTVALVTNEGPLDGRYIVSSIRTPLLPTDRGKLKTPHDIEVTLKRPQEPLPEPAPETKTKTSSFDLAGASAAGAGDLEGIDFSKGGWGGTEAIFVQALDPLARKMGLTIGGRKEGGHAVGGDHDPSVENAFACDYGTYTGMAFAKAVCELLGVSTDIIGTFTKATFRIGNRTFGCQVLWGVEDHHDHVHVGVRAGGY